MHALATHRNLAFTSTELAELADVPTGGINKTISRLKEKAIVRHFEADGLWAAADDSAIADYVGAFHSEDTLGDAFEEFADDWYGDHPGWADELPDLGPVTADDANSRQE